MRSVRYFLGSFRVLVPTKKSPTPAEIYQTRQVVCKTFEDAHRELQRATVLDLPIQPHVFVSQLRLGSLELQVIYQALIELPWHEIVQSGRKAAGQGFTILEHIGAVAAGLETLKQIGPWIKRRLGGAADSRPSEDRDSGPRVKVTHESSLRIDPHGFSMSDIAIKTAHELFHDSTPRAVLVLLDPEAITVVRRVLHVSTEERTYHLGGKTIIHDMNLMMNGMSSPEQMRNGDVFCFHNPGAIGLQEVSDEDSLFDACLRTGELQINDLALDAQEFAEKLEIVDGSPIDIDDLPSSR